jgi:acyl-homoserine-lactone acylase
MTKIYRDNFGVPHLEAGNYSEAVFAIAYVHCEDDFYTIQQWLLSSRKEGGHMDDWDAPYIDFICEFLEIEKYANYLKKNISSEYLALIQSYCSGINEYAKENQKEVLKKNLFPISDIDIIKTQHLMEILGIQLDKPYSYINNNRKIKIPKKQGSNIIAVTKSKSENGNALIAINPHQQMEGLFSFYEIHIKIKQPNIELYGFILPCTFTIFMGTNFKTAWGFTANYPEMYDIYKLNVKGLIYKYITIDEHNEKIIPQYYINHTNLYGKIPLPILIKYYKSKLGNIIKMNGEYFFIRIPLLGKILGSEINHELAKCKSNSEIKQLCFKKRYGYLNLVSIDIENNILYIHNALEQEKLDNNTHYQNFIELKSEKQISNQFYGFDNLIYYENPKCDYLISSNQSPFIVTDEKCTKSSYHKGLLYFNENSRYLRIKTLIKNKATLCIEDLKHILFDTKVIKPIIRNIDFSALFSLKEHEYPKLSKLISILKDWDGNAELNSKGAALFSLFYNKYKEKYYVSSKNPDTIQKAEIEEIIYCLNWASKYYKPNTLLKDIQFIKRGKVVLPISGIPDSVNSVRPYFEKGKLYSEEGGAFRLVMNLKNRQIFACHPFGSSSNVNDDNSTNQMKLFVNNQYREIKDFDFYKKNFKYYTL